MYVDVAIVGGGIAGLTAANLLLEEKNSIKLVVLEAKNRLGGRTYGVHLKSKSGTNSWDLGGQWIGKCQPHIHKLVSDIGLETYEQYSTGKKVVQLDTSNSISEYSNDIPPISLFSNFELQLFIWKMRRLVKKSRRKDFMNSKFAQDLDLCTLEHFKHCNLWSEGAKNALDACCRSIFGADPKHMSALFFILYSTRAGGFESLISCKANFGAQELKIKGGAWQICERLADKLPKDAILRNAVVVSIEQDSEVVIRCLDGRIIRCMYLIMAIPPHELIRINFNPSLPRHMFHVFQRLPVSYMTKIVITYPESFWKRKGFSGEVITSGGNGKHPLCVVFDASLDNQSPALVAFVGGEQQINFSYKKPEERKASVLGSLSSFLGPEALDPLDYAEKDWSYEAFNGGCPVNIATPGVTTSLTPALFHPFFRVFFAGTETASHWCGFMNGAVQSGQRAAKEVLYNLDQYSLTKEDLKDTCYEPIHAPFVDPSIHPSFNWLSLICSVGTLFVASVVVYKLSKV